ncbi:polysaccharide pyruvyl transferase family protein [Nodosilinea sp. FACHB-131]|uniref:polysaccharide pyruvyl transferase family protein n=1 Tax=Cyanophyceae TaxID=3028117 RepID=UPI001685144C|nr:polysaccharide pyruvyl transferase family protein [Nodosilinea sp. FACHB-131]MBD1872386.1 polysaccharide pyruvyl transferase family protein [Nodosilinea sp. FACHB-131]
MLSKNGITICGFYGNFNLGDEAMLEGMIDLFRTCQDDLKFTIISNNPKDTLRRFNVPAIRMKSPKVWPAIAKNRHFVLGGGDLLRDSVHKSVAASWLPYMQKAIALKRNTMLLGVSVGEIWRQETKELVPKVLNKVNLIAVRDDLSKARLEELGVSQKIYVMSDLALQSLALKSNKTKKDFIERKANTRLEVGVSVRNLDGRGRSLDGADHNKLQGEIAKIIDSLIEKYEARVHLIPFRTLENSLHPIDDDYVSSLEVLRHSRYSAQCIVHRCFTSLDELGQLISRLDLMMGMRLHSLILSSGMGVPVIAAQYDPKVEGFMREIGQSHLSFPLSEFTHKKIFPVLCDTLDNLPVVANKMTESVSNYERRIETLESDLKSILS